MKLAFYWPFDKAEQIYPYWRDGLRAAIEEIGINHDVDVFLGGNEPNGNEYDAILLWDDSNSPHIPQITAYPCKTGLILTTMPENFSNLSLLDVVFCESQVVYDAVRRHGIRACFAFGTDTNFFTPDVSVKKDIEYFYPATFSPWKRQRDIAHLGKDLWCVGTVQADGQEDLQACLEKGVNVAEGYYKAEHIRDLYRRARWVVIPAIHGSERTVLETMSINLLPSVNPQNIKASSYVEEYKQSSFESPRAFVLKHYNPKQYAEKILKALL